MCKGINSMSRHTHQSGFTLVELSIVLVIIGLILGGVMVGRSMIRSMQVNRVASDLEAYVAAAQMFVDKYQGLPGDITNATTFWGATVANGNGNGQLDAAGAVSTAGELFGAWEQMALAGLIKGKYSGLAGAGGVQHAVPGTNAPKGSLSATVFAWLYRGMQSASGSYYDGYLGNTIWFGTANTADVPYTAALTPGEAYAIDLKIDDGVPGTGNLQTQWNVNTCNTGTASTGPTSTYLTTSTAVTCFLIFKTGL
jgi:prepilin-type N-terminal cleavage/methylation domain-containing protein